MKLRKWEVVLLTLAGLSLLLLLMARTIGFRASAGDGAFTRIARPGIAFWGEQIDVEVRIDADQLPNCGAVGDVEPIYAALVIDRSSSMNDAIEQARNAASDFVDLMNLTEEGDAVTVVAFDHNAQVLQKLTPDRRLAIEAIERIEAYGETNIVEGLERARQQLLSSQAPPNTRLVMILLSDGEHRGSGDPVATAAQAKSQGIRVVAIALGDADKDTLRQIASSSSDYYETADPTALLNIYGEIAAGLVGSVATEVTLQEYFNNEEFSLARKPSRSEQNNNQITSQVPFVGRNGRSIGYALEPNGLGWPRVSPTEGSLSLFDCNGQAVNQNTPLGPRVLILFPVWLLYIAPLLALLWLLSRLAQALRATPSGSTSVVRPGDRTTPSKGKAKAEKEKPDPGADVTHGRPSRPKKRK